MKPVKCMLGLHEFDKPDPVIINRNTVYNLTCKECGKKKIVIWKTLNLTAYVNVDGVWKKCMNVYQRVK